MARSTKLNATANYAANAELIACNVNLGPGDAMYMCSVSILIHIKV